MGALITEVEIIKMMRDVYHHRLEEAVNETDVFDKRGNMVLGKDLKVRHKDSQFEYTVDDVLKDTESEEIQIHLRFPDEPRFEKPPEEEDQVIMDRADRSDPEVLGEQEEDVQVDLTKDPSVKGPEDPDDVEIFVIDQEEFEKEYEVK
jgi:hypothetical protein